MKNKPEFLILTGFLLVALLGLGMIHYLQWLIATKYQPGQEFYRVERVR